MGRATAGRRSRSRRRTSAASSRRSVRSAVATTRRAGGPVESARRSATSSPRRCGAGSESNASGGRAEVRSATPPNDSRASDSAGRATRTVAPRARARSTASRQTVVLPIPGSPTIASARAVPSRNASTAFSSGSRPTTPGIPRAYAANRASAGAIEKQFQSAISEELVRFLVGTLADVRRLVYPPLRQKTMKIMLQTIYTANLTEAASAASVPCRYALVVDERRPGFAPTLAERCAR